MCSLKDLGLMCCLSSSEGLCGSAGLLRQAEDKEWLDVQA